MTLWNDTNDNTHNDNNVTRANVWFGFFGGVF